MTERCTHLVNIELSVSHHTYKLNCTHLQSLQRVQLSFSITEASILHIVSHCPQ